MFVSYKKDIMDTESNFRTMTTVMQGVSEDITSRAAIGGIDFLGIPSGFKKLDDATLGFRNNAFYVVGAATSVGKSSWGTSAMLNMARPSKYLANGSKVLYITLEMNADLLVYRLLSSITRIPSLDIERGRFKEGEEMEVRRAQDELNSLPITFVDESLNTTTLLRTLHEAKDKDLVDIVILDYLTLVQTDGGSKISAYERVTAISEFVRIAARDLNIPFITLVQLNRNIDGREDKTPLLSDIRDSGGIAQDAHAVILLSRPQYYERQLQGGEYMNEEKNATMILAKNRQGPVGGLPVTFVNDRMEWLDPYVEQQAPRNLRDMVRTPR